jgi:hypothetical protein
MRIIEKVTEAEMAAIFLRAEIASSRFGKDILRILEKDGVDRKVIDKPDVKDADENEYRAVLLGEFRGYQRNEELFQDFPDDVRWHRVLLDRKDLLKVKYINYSYWNDLSGGSRLVAKFKTTADFGWQLKRSKAEKFSRKLFLSVKMSRAI